MQLRLFPRPLSLSLRNTLRILLPLLRVCWDGWGCSPSGRPPGSAYDTRPHTSLPRRSRLHTSIAASGGGLGSGGSRGLTTPLVRILSLRVSSATTFRPAHSDALPYQVIALRVRHRNCTGANNRCSSSSSRSGSSRRIIVGHRERVHVEREGGSPLKRGTRLIRDISDRSEGGQQRGRCPPSLAVTGGGGARGGSSSAAARRG